MRRACADGRSRLLAGEDSHCFTFQVHAEVPAPDPAIGCVLMVVGRRRFIMTHRAVRVPSEALPQLDVTGQVSLSVRSPRDSTGAGLGRV